jgi:hypothetical protein
MSLFYPLETNVSNDWVQVAVLMVQQTELPGTSQEAG